MTAVSQRVSNFLGGISQQADEKMLPGQVKEALNCYPDMAFGLIKRPGGKFLNQLANLSPKVADDKYWFTIFRDEIEQYIASIGSDGAINIWDLKTGVAKTVNYPNGKEALVKAYLASVLNTGDTWKYTQLKSLTLNDFTYVLNTKVKVDALPTPSYQNNLKATVTITEVDYLTTYKILFNGVEAGSITTKTDLTPADQATPRIDFKTEVIEALAAKITSGYKTKEVVNNTIVFTFNTPTTVTVAGGSTGQFMHVFQEAENIAKLPEQSTQGTIVRIKNTSADKDDYYVEFMADNNSSGTGHWEETRAPNVSPGINPNAMPIAIIRNANGTFTATFLDGSKTVNNFKLIWEPRLVGDDETNSHPSFVGNTIQDMFLFNNRLGFLTQDNVSMSQAGDYYNFYHKSALTQTISDPIDLSCASTKPAILHAVLPVAQGLLLFSRSQQFLMEAEEGAWTPASVSIRTISNYECDPYLQPTDLGATVLFASKNSNWTRVFEIFTRGQREAPQVSESSLQVSEWMPTNLTRTIGNAQNGVWLGTSKDTSDVYLYRYYVEGEERKLASWVKWKLFGNIIHTAIQNDILYALVSDVKGYTVVSYPLILAPSSGGLVNHFGNVVDPALDAWQEVTNDVYDPIKKVTRVYLPTNYRTNGPELKYVVGILKDKTGKTDEELKRNGLTNVIDVKTTVFKDATGIYFEIPTDVSAKHIYVGYSFLMDVELPRYLFSEKDSGYDFAGYTTTARMHFYTGLGGSVYFQLSDNTRQTWKDISGVRVANNYRANNAPFRDHFIYNVPVYQRPDNYVMKIQSSTPFPVSVVAMEWQGQYSPGFYRRS